MITVIFFAHIQRPSRSNESTGLLLNVPMVFFFQAEDGIRDRSPSRGLGDVYKRQGNYTILAKSDAGNSSKKVDVNVMGKVFVSKLT